MLLTKSDLRAIVEEVINEVFNERINVTFDDIDWRIAHLNELKDKVSAENLNLMQHHLTGYTVTNNSPAAGSIAWTNLRIVHQGVDYAITNGNSALRYLWWDKSVSTTALQATSTKPTVAAEDVLVFINDGGIAYPMPGSTQHHGSALVGSTVDTAEMKALAVTSAILGANAVIAGKLADGSIDTSARFTTGVVNAASVGAGQISEVKMNTLLHFIY